MNYQPILTESEENNCLVQINKQLFFYKNMGQYLKKTFSLSIYCDILLSLIISFPTIFLLKSRQGSCNQVYTKQRNSDSTSYHKRNLKQFFELWSVILILNTGINLQVIGNVSPQSNLRKKSFERTRNNHQDIYNLFISRLSRKCGVASCMLSFVAKSRTELYFVQCRLILTICETALCYSAILQQLVL